jgi:endonuclease YncB( thermonuclease family)
MAGYRDPYVRIAIGAQRRRRPLLLLLIAAICLTGFYAFSRNDLIHPRFAPRPHVDRAAGDQSPIAGPAWIVDGDSIRIGGVSIRLEGIDAPEWDQSCTDANGKAWLCGQAATRRLREHARGQSLTCAPRAHDRYGRVVASCTMPDGLDLNAWLVREGLAIASGHSGIYRDEEAEAKAAKHGIWAGSFMPPSEWRRLKGKGPHHHHHRW